MSNIDPKVSEYFRQLAKKRTDNHRGFNDPQVQAKIREIRKAKHAAKNAETKTQEVNPEA